MDVNERIKRHQAENVEKSRRYPLRLPAAVYEYLQNEAEKRNMAMNALILIFIANGLEEMD